MGYRGYVVSCSVSREMGGKGRRSFQLGLFVLCPCCNTFPFVGDPSFRAPEKVWEWTLQCVHLLFFISPSPSV